jgi:tetratricopeptide (TPR) repeat protein
MKTASPMICAFALVTISVLSAGAEVDDPTIPLKCRSKSPEVRAACGLPPLPEEKPLTADMSKLGMLARRVDPARCATVTVSPPVKFRGRTLVEIPDIREPRLRLANELMSNGCSKRAFDLLDAVLRADPDNREALYVYSRISWMTHGLEESLPLLEQTVAKYPDFHSAKVLLAGMRFAQNRLPDAVPLLDAVAQESPTDVWLYLGRAKVEAVRTPTRDLFDRMMEIASNPAFPPNARAGALEAAAWLPDTAQGQGGYEQVLKARLALNDPINAAYYATEYAIWLGEGEGRFSEVVKLFESPQSRSMGYLNDSENRMLLAQAYLMEAAKVSPRPGPANQHLISKADHLVNGDYTVVARHAQPRPYYPTIKPFLDALVHPLEEDGQGFTRLCAAIDQLNADQVREALQAGADPYGRCRGESLVGSLVFMATSDDDDKRRDVMKALLEGGAPVTNIDACRSKDQGDCSKVLLPLMEKYSRKGK